MKPYYERGGITIYHADCREILPQLEAVDVIITDPVWPNAIPSLIGSDDPYGLFAAVATHFPRLAQRVVVQLGCDSDPRFLSAIPPSLPYLRTCWLEYAVPGYKGRVLNTSDVAYVFGVAPPSREGARVMPGIVKISSGGRNGITHPCPRRLEHVKWLVSWYARGTVLDPFAGSGTTLLAAKELGLPAIGVDISEEFCREAVRRLAQEVMVLDA